MSWKQLHLSEALGLLMKTTPILLVRLGVYLAFWVVSLVYFAVVIGIAVLLGKLASWLGFIFALIGLGGAFPLYNLVYRYVFYIIKAAHLAVIAELLEHGDLPAGVNQLAWGKEQVQGRFGEVSAMFVVDELVEGVVGAFTGTVSSIASWLPGDTLQTLVNVVNRVIRFATTYIDEAILARSFWRRDESVWTTAQEGLVLYGMAWKPLLTNAVALMLLSYLPFLVSLILFAAPVAFLLSLLSETLAAWSVLFLFALAYLIKVAVGDAFAMTAMVAAFQRETANLTPDPAMEARLQQVSDKFGELKRRAEEALRARTSALPTPTEKPAASNSPSQTDTGPATQ